MPNNFQDNINLRKSLLDQLKSQTTIFRATEMMVLAIKKGNKILIFGNGGSATQASHFVAEMVNKFYMKRDGIPGIALTDNGANITSIANDSDFKYVFSRQIEALGKPGDIALGVTTSGRSKNVLEALKLAKRNHLKTIGLSGRNIDDLKTAKTDLIIAVDCDDTPAIQEIHLFILHTMAEKLEADLFGEAEDNGD
jgi:D-sedoheptulose 7-phosphate isomerase